MPPLDHFHAPLRGSRHWEGFHHAWATNIAQHLNRGVLPEGFFAEATLEIDIASFEAANGVESHEPTGTLVWAPPRPAFSFPVDFSSLDVCEVRVYEELGGPMLRAAIELVSPANKDRPGNRRTFAAKCGGYLKQAIGVVIVDAVTERAANLHAEIMETLEIPGEAWLSPTNLYAIAYRPVPVQHRARIDVWPEAFAVGAALPVLPLWISSELCLPLNLEETYMTTCEGLRIRVS